MRIYANLYECAKETQRNLSEMGIEVRIKTMQNIDVCNDEDLNITKELTVETYQIEDPYHDDSILDAYYLIYGDKGTLMMEWAVQELGERLFGYDKNPGEAYKLRENEWKQFLNQKGEFDYTYHERIKAYEQIPRLIEYLINDPGNRRSILSIWDASKDCEVINQKVRVPCSIDYHFMIRDNQLNMIYRMRSSDFYTHWLNDMFLAMKLNEYIAKKIEIKPGKLIVYIDSLHAYKRELKIRGIF